MSVETLRSQAKQRSAFRTWFPWVVVGLAACGIALLWVWPAPELEEVWRVLGTEALILAGGLLLFVWAFFLSYFSWVLRRRILLVTVLAAVGLVASIREVRFTGNMVPIPIPRWARDLDATLEEHRNTHSGLALAPVLLTDLPTDFPEYRGRRRDGVVTGPALARDWAARPPRLLWRQPAGGGYAAFAVAGNLAVTIEQRRDQEAIVGYDTASGGQRWLYSYPARFSEKMGGDGPRATPTLADGRVYALGATGKLVCLDAQTGRRHWDADILEGDNLPWGISGSPLVYDRYVVVGPGKQGAGGHTLVAYDRTSGQKAWAAGEARAGYSSPMLATFAGVRQILLFDGERLAGYDASTGQELWHYEWRTNPEVNAAQPIVLDGDRVFISSGYGVGCIMLKVSRNQGKWEASPVWTRKTTMRCKFTSPVALGGYLYGLDEGILVCLDEKTGDRTWRGGRYGHGQLLLSGDLLVILAETGELALVEANPAAYRELGRITVFDSKTWNCPALANGKAYLRNDQEMACYDLAEADPTRP